MRAMSRTGAAFAAAVVLAGGTGVANAAIERRLYHGLWVYDDSHGNGLVGEINVLDPSYNIVDKVTNHPGVGDRMQILTPFRDRNPANANGVHTSVDWYKNGSYCYASGFGIDKEGISASQNCTSGWNGYGKTESPDFSDTAWHTHWHIRAFDPQSQSIRGAIHICQRESDDDPCSGKRFADASY